MLISSHTSDNKNKRTNTCTLIKLYYQMSANYSYMEEMISTPELHLPGFRFHPTEEELLGFYLKNIVFGKSLSFDIIGFLNIYHHDPWDLPGLAKNVGEREWYFFVPIDRKHGSGGRPNRTTEKGYWKATGSDRKVVSLISEPKRVLGLRKTLVFYKGRAPKGTKTDWVMNEYRLPDNCKLLKEIVMCKVYRKATSLKVLEQRAAMEEEMKIINTCCSSSSIDSFSFCGPQEDELMTKVSMNQMTLKKEEELVVSKNKIDEKGIENIKGSFSKPMLQIGMDYNLSEIQVPKLSMDFCNQDQFWAQLNSPWLQNLTPIFNILNF